MLEKLMHAISEWLACERDCPCGTAHCVTTKTVRLDDCRGTALIETLRELGLAGQPLVVSDINTHEIAAEITGTLRGTSIGIEEHVFESAALVADESSVDALSRAIGTVNPRCLIGVGSGTINDICKTAATQREIPYISYPTAASMNGYTSTVASLKRDGLKVTDPVVAPVAVVVDLDVIRRSPRDMTAAGAADLLSKFVCNADWILARLIEGGYYCDASARLATLAADAVIDDLDGIAARTEHGVATLTAALLLSGIAMAAAGSSSPASGGEHLVSHYWDMCGPEGHRLHGAQVGLGTLLCAQLYETLSAVNPAGIEPKVPCSDTSDAELADHFGSAAPAVIAQARQKRRTVQDARRRVAFIKDHWTDIWFAVSPVLKSADQVRSLLTRAGAPTTLSALKLDHSAATDALRWARHIRARYTVLDFAADIGRFGEEDRQQVVDQSGIK